MSNQLTGAEIVFKALNEHGVKFIFGYPGGAVLPLYDEISKQKNIKHILVRHEQGAGHAAEGYARSSGKPGIALVTSGPGATNMVTALTDAYMDSSISLYYWTSSNAFNWNRCFSRMRYHWNHKALYKT